MPLEETMKKKLKFWTEFVFSFTEVHLRNYSSWQILIRIRVLYLNKNCYAISVMKWFSKSSILTLIQVKLKRCFYFLHSLMQKINFKMKRAFIEINFLFTVKIIFSEQQYKKITLTVILNIFFSLPRHNLEKKLV